MKYLILLLFSLAACYGKKPERTNKEGKPMPVFKILLSDSTSLLNTKDIPAGKPIVIFIFGPHCPFSKAQMQDLLDNKEKLNGMQIIAITPYPFRQMKEFYETYSIEKYANITMGMDRGNFFGTYMSAHGAPYIAIYDKQKNLVKAYEGTTDFNQIKSSL